MPSKSLYLLVTAIVGLFAAALLATLALQSNQQQVSKVQQTLSPAGGEAAAAPSSDSELTAQRELICVDRVLAGAIPEGSTVTDELVKCSPTPEPSKPAPKPNPK